MPCCGPNPETIVWIAAKILNPLKGNCVIAYLKGPSQDLLKCMNKQRTKVLRTCGLILMKIRQDAMDVMMEQPYRISRILTRA